MKSNKSETEDAFNRQKILQIKRIENDKSSKGSIDEEIKPLIELINKKENLYSTSSCSGRIVVIEKPTEKKCDAHWLLVSHSHITAEDIISIDYPHFTSWFMFEPAILHICARTVQDAESFLETARRSGFKRAGYFSIKRRIILEIFGTEKMELPIAEKEKLLVSEDYIKRVVKEANKKLKDTHKKIKKLTNVVTSL